MGIFHCYVGLAEGILLAKIRVNSLSQGIQFLPGLNVSAMHPFEQ